MHSKSTIYFHNASPRPLCFDSMASSMSRFVREALPDWCRPDSKINFLSAPTVTVIRRSPTDCVYPVQTGFLFSSEILHFWRVGADKLKSWKFRIQRGGVSLAEYVGTEWETYISRLRFVIGKSAFEVFFFICTEFFFKV